MASDNQTTIAGNLVETPELRFTNTGTPVTNLRVAVTQRIQQDGEWRDGETSFFKVNVWRGQAEHLADSLTKGDRVMITGRLRQRTWETPEGEKRSVAEIEAERSEPASNSPPPRSKAPASADPATAAKDGSGRPNAAATSTTSHPSEHRSRLSAPPTKPGALACGSALGEVADHQRSTLHNVRGNRFPAIVLPPAHRRPRSPQWSSASASSPRRRRRLPGPGILRGPRWHLDGGVEAVRPATARPAPCSGQSACPRGLVAGAKSAATLGHGGLTARPSPGTRGHQFKETLLTTDGSD
jgi:single-strand DNA-binding protein